MRVVGVDGGIASIGWAIVDIESSDRNGKIIATGTRMFHSPEGQSSTGKQILKNKERRENRGARRTVRRRRKRMAEIRKLFHEYGLLDSCNKAALAGHGLDPWELRAEALERLLTQKELAICLGHIAKHRGFQSNKKGEKPNKASDDQKMLQAAGKIQEKLAKYSTVGEMFARDPEFAKRKRNREGDYSRSILREDQKDEVRKIFSVQTAKGSGFATAKLREKFEIEAFHQLPIQSSEGMVGQCPFIPEEKRASAFSPSFEKFRFLSKLVNLRIVRELKSCPLTEQERNSAIAHFGKTKTYTYKALRKVLGLDADEKFAQISRNKEDKEFVRSDGAAQCTNTLIGILSDAIGSVETQSLLAKGKALDDAIAIIAFNEDTTEIKHGLNKLDLPDDARSALFDSARHGEFHFIKGTGHISAAAARRLNPHLEKGCRYDEACANEGWDHSAQREWKLEDIKSPVAQKSAREIMKQIKVLEHEYGPFDRVHVEMAREVGKSIEERDKIKSGQDKRESARNAARNELAELLNLSHVSGEDILRYELWKEQKGFCLYSGDGIHPSSIVASDNTVQVDHILPISRFGDNSYLNKTLCFTTENQNKKNKTPFEWFKDEKPEDWERFVAAVESCEKIKGIKKRNYLLMEANSEVEEKWLARNLNDTRYALRVVLALLRKNYPDFDDVDEKGNIVPRRRVFARPGRITSALRRAWGLESAKFDPKTRKRISDDRNHALDAIITACCSESLLQEAIRKAKERENKGDRFEFRFLPSPWGDVSQFRREVLKAVNNVFVSRPESGRIRGKGHDAGIRQIREIAGEKKLFVRKSVNELKLSDLDNIPVPKPYGSIKEPEKLRDQLVENLRQWISKREELNQKIKALKGKSDEKTKLQQQLAELVPLSPKGDPVKKVRLQINTKPAIEVRNGSADRADMIRVDIFSKANKKGKEQFYLVPIYRNDYFSANGHEIPCRAAVANKPEEMWPVMDSSYRFRFSLYAFSLVEVVKPDGETLFGYFRGLHRGTASISISKSYSSQEIRSSIGAKTLISFKKFHVDRLGSIPPHEISQETRTWRGKVCT